jgi:pilus assembly protein CpaE
MLTAVLFTLDATLADALRELLSRSRQIRLDKAFSRAVQNYEAVRAANSFDPDVILIDFSDPEPMEEILLSLSQNSPRAVRVGLGDPDRLPPEAAALIHGWLSFPMREALVEQGVIDAVRRHAEMEDRPFFTFLPAKAGCGATTTALHVADALANELRHSTLLLDADLRSGVVAELLNVEPPRSLRDALAMAAELQPTMWYDYVVRVEKLDALVSRPGQDGPLPLWTDYFKLLQFAAPRYEALVVDLPELINDATFEVVRHSRRVFVVTTAELLALKLAARRLAEIAARGVAPDRIALVLNRWQKTDLAVAEVERILEQHVSAVLPNDYRAVQRAAVAGGIVNPESVLGKAYRDFAVRLWEGKDSTPTLPSATRGMKALFGLRG